MSKPANVILTGFMGTGKTTVGQLVAAQTGLRFVDTDAEIVARAGMTIPDVFAQQGEPAFRALESGICAELATRSGQVIATGGGALVDPCNRDIMQAAGLLVCLTARPDVIRERLADFDGRPLATNWEHLLRERRAAYAQIPHQIDTSEKSPEQVATEVVALWQS